MIFWLPPPSLGLDIYKIGIIRSPGQYSQEIRDGFIEELHPSDDFSFMFNDKLGYAHESEASLNIMVARSVLEWGATLLVTIGSSASHSIANYYKDTSIPILFLGITDPVGGGLVQTFDAPRKSNITGVAFPIPIERKIRTVQLVFPQAKAFCFVYDSELTPDVMYVKWVRQYAKTHIEPIIHLLDIGQTHQIPEEMKNTAQLFFGWYAVHLYSLAMENPDIPFIGATFKGCQEGAVMSIYPKLPELGKQGAEMALQILHNRIPPGQISVENPKKYGLCFNRKKINMFGIKISEDFMALADEIIDE